MEKRPTMRVISFYIYIHYLYMLYNIYIHVTVIGLILEQRLLDNRIVARNELVSFRRIFCILISYISSNIKEVSNIMVIGSALEQFLFDHRIATRSGFYVFWPSFGHVIMLNSKQYYVTTN